MQHDDRPDLLSKTPSELRQYCQSTGLPVFRAKQIFSWLHRGCQYEEMTDLPHALRVRLQTEAPLRFPTIAQKLISATDGTVKYIFRLHDGEIIESVVMQYHHGTTICISSQVGCRMGCRFCASTLHGKVRDLAPSELLGQILIAAKDLQKRIDGVVLMGIGEPLDNYENVLRFLHLVSDPAGVCIGLRHISLSTCGLVDRIDALAQQALGITLSVSLHAPSDALRSEIMPINRKWNIAALLDATVRYFEKTGRRVSFEYTLIHGKNDTLAQAKALGDTLLRHTGRRMPLHVNLIPVNPVAERGFSPAQPARIKAFAAALQERGITATVRRRLGQDIDAACGQLRARFLQKQQKATPQPVAPPAAPFPPKTKQRCIDGKKGDRRCDITE